MQLFRFSRDSSLLILNIFFRVGWNKEVTTKVGIPLVEGITHYMNAEYDEAVQKLAPIMPELQQKIQVNLRHTFLGRFLTILLIIWLMISLKG